MSEVVAPSTDRNEQNACRATTQGDPVVTSADERINAYLAIDAALKSLDAELKGCTPSMLMSVLAASGHTIIQLPELDELDCVSATPGSGKVRCYLDDARMTADDARDLAGLLLAAATAAEVTRSNLAKIVDGKVQRRADGKIQKPSGRTGPHIAGALKAAGWVEP